MFDHLILVAILHPNGSQARTSIANVEAKKSIDAKEVEHFFTRSNPELP
jgi:hypothetical protein